MYGEYVENILNTMRNGLDLSLAMALPNAGEWLDEAKYTKGLYLTKGGEPPRYKNLYTRPQCGWALSRECPGSSQMPSLTMDGGD
jgi:hypothetical protein